MTRTTFSTLIGLALASQGFAQLNPGFELGASVQSTQTIPNWTVFGNAYREGAPEIQAGWAHGGAYVLKMFGTFGSPGQNDTGAFQDFTISPGQTATASAWGNNPGIDKMQVPNFSFLRVAFFDSANNEIANSGANTSPFIDATTPLDTWTQYTASAVAPAGTAKGRLFFLFIQIGYIGGSTWWDDVSVTVSSPVTTVSGTITFGNYSGTNPSSVPFEFRNTTTGAVISSGNATVDTAGNYTVNAPSTAGAYNLHFKASHWLGNNVGVNTSSGNVTGANIVLTNGDIDGNNIININDYAKLSDAFNTTPSDAAWYANADLDGNGIININDYSVLSDNFNLVGI